MATKRARRGLKARRIRTAVQIGFFILVALVAAAATFVQKIHESAFVLMAIAFGIAVLVGPAFCGWACPFGSFQE